MAAPITHKPKDPALKMTWDIFVDSSVWYLVVKERKEREILASREVIWWQWKVEKANRKGEDAKDMGSRTAHPAGPLANCWPATSQT
jgi:hypothetical protein